MQENLSFLNGSATEVAPLLLGCILERVIDDRIVRGRIVEVEAYDQTDIASHSYNGETPRTKVMFGPAGYLYVYFTYGMHYCCNVVVGGIGYGSAVLIRALEPLEGEPIMEQRRRKTGIDLTNGPAKLCQALAIDRTLNGHDLTRRPLRLLSQAPLPAALIIQTTRIGLSKAKDVPWRFYIAGNPWVSRP